MLYITGFIIVFGPVCRSFRKKLSEIEYDVNLECRIIGEGQTLCDANVPESLKENYNYRITEWFHKSLPQ